MLHKQGFRCRLQSKTIPGHPDLYLAKHNAAFLSMVVSDIGMMNDYDYKLALLEYESVDMNDKTTLDDLCKEAGIDINE